MKSRTAISLSGLALLAWLVSAVAVPPAGAASPAATRARTPATQRSAVTRRASARPEAEVLPMIPIVPPTGPQPSFKLYQQLLDDYVHVDSPKDSALETSFNYEKFYDERTRTERTQRIRAEFMALSPAAMDARTRTAWAINFYNYMVIELTTDNLLIPGKYRQRWLSVRDIKFQGDPFFSATVVTIDSVPYSLDAFEKHFLFADFDHAVGAVPPSSLDPRVHFAVVCGARGCPPLEPRAFRPESLDLQLDRAVRATLASSTQLSQDPQNGIFKISTLFSWYVADFGGREKLLPWILQYAPARRRAALKAAIPVAQFGLLPYDWALNQTPGWRFDEMMNRPLTGTKPARRDTT